MTRRALGRMWFCVVVALVAPAVLAREPFLKEPHAAKRYMIAPMPGTAAGIADLAAAHGAILVPDEDGPGEYCLEMTDAAAEAIRQDARVASVRLVERTTGPPEHVEASSPWPSGDYAYDGSGSIRSIGPDQYTYDNVGRLVKGTVAQGQSAQSYTYDGFGNIEKIETTSAPARTFRVNH
ncbi:MAG TPA: hypothetical protein VM733_17400, partial [Thermoanaerobaculia bacterium]|nr:hypothetical protein [Thermoanaerobaculia bacterium]